MTKLKDLRWGDYPELSKWVQCNHNVSQKNEERRVKVRDRERNLKDAIATLKNGGRNQEQRH